MSRPVPHNNYRSSRHRFNLCKSAVVFVIRPIFQAPAPMQRYITYPSRVLQMSIQFPYYPNNEGRKRGMNE